MCQNYKSETGRVFGNNCHFQHVEAEGKPNKRSKKGGARGSAAILKESIQIGCVSQDFYPRKFILREPGKLGTKHTTKLKFGKERVHREELSNSVRLMSVVLCAPKFGKRSHEETLHQERCARKAAWDLAKSICKLKIFGQSYVLHSCLSKCNGGTHFNETTGARIRS